MPLLNESTSSTGSRRGLWILGLLSAIALIVSIIALLQHGGAAPPAQTGTAPGKPTAKTSVLRAIARDGVLRVGYGGFPPYTIIDPKETDPNRRVKGFSVDLVNEIARRSTPPLRVEWHRFSWDTLKADMDSGKFDFIADPVFQTVPRAMDFGLCEPYSYFGIAVAVVRKDETRFKSFQDLDRPDITIALAEGWTSSEFARKNLTKPKFKSIPVTGDAVNQLDEVLFGRADVALNDVPSVAQYVRAHPDKVKALWLNNPPSSVPGGFMTRKEDTDIQEFLNSSVRVLEADGLLNRLDDKWKAYGFIPTLSLAAGKGLSTTSIANSKP